MTKPMKGAGRIVVRDITQSDRERMPDWHPGDIEGRPSFAGIAGAALVVVAFCVAAAWWVFA